MAGSLYWPQRQTPRGSPRRLIGTDDPVAAAQIVPRRIADHNRQIKLVALLRDPVERAISHYRHAVRQGWESSDPVEAFSGALRPEALSRARLLPNESLSAYVTFGEYARILDGYHAVFGPEQIYIVPFLDLQNEPDAAVNRVLHFIGIHDAWATTNSGQRYNASDSVAKLRWLDTRRIERLTSESQACQRLWARITPWARRLVDEIFMHATRIEERRNRVTRTDPPGPEYDEVRAALEAHYAPWNKRLRVANGQVSGVTDR
jgi:hypothetical protein